MQIISPSSSQSTLAPITYSHTKKSGCCQPGSSTSKIGKVALAILLTMVTLGLLLCFKNGRKVWTGAINSCKKPLPITEKTRTLSSHLKPPPPSLPSVSPPASPSNSLSPRIKNAKIPAEAQTFLRKWLIDNRDLLKSKFDLGKRIEYDPANIPRALHAFQNVRCSWHEMTLRCTSKEGRENMQIINDLRSAYLEKYYALLMDKFGNKGIPDEFDDSLKKINDFGSDNLTSDRDFSLQVNGEHISKEAEIADFFNCTFESDWGASSATIFDCNAYTMQYVRTASDPIIERERASLQQAASLLMKLRTSTAEHWDQFKKATLILLYSVPEAKKMKEKEFAKIEQQQFELNKILLKQADQTESLKRIEAFPHKSKEAGDAAAAEVAALQDTNPELYIEASNTLFVNYKKEMRQLEDRRIGLIHCTRTLYDLCKTREPIAFVKKFNEELDIQIDNLKQKKNTLINTQSAALIDERLQHCERAKILPGQEWDVMKAFEDRAEHEKFAKRAQKERAHLDEIQHLIKKYKILKKNIQMPTAVAKLEMDKVATALERITQKPLNYLLSKEAAQGIKAKIKRADKLIAAQRAEYEANLKNYKAATKKQFWHAAGIFNLEGDRLLLELQQKNLIGNCFMRESHGSEGACAVVMENLQAGMTQLRSINQYMQAFREISGYFSGHQMKQKTARSKVIEVSKYAVRMLLVIEFIKDRGRTVGIQSLKVDKDMLTKSAQFFAKLASFRKKGNKGHEIMQAVEDIASSFQLSPRGGFQAADLESINSNIIDLSAALEAWCTVIEHDEAEAIKLNSNF